MTEPVGLNPEGLTNAASKFGAIAETLQNTHDTLESDAASKGTPWGDGPDGHKFADGDKGYIANAKNSIDGLAALVGDIQQIRDNLNDAVKTIEQNEADVSGASKAARSVKE